MTLLTLLIAVLAGVRAERNIGAWIVEHDESEGHYAVTTNDSGNLLEQFCFPEWGSCVWLLGIDTACDEGLVNTADLGRFRSAFGTVNRHADLNGSGGLVNSADLALFRGLFGKTPGPSRLAP